MSLLISAAGAGDQSAFGSPSIINAASGAVNVTMGDQARFGRRTVVSFDTLGRNVEFDFTEPHVPATLQVSFYFGDTIVVPAVSAGDQSRFGSHEVENAAQGILVLGIPPPRLMGPLVYPAGLIGAGLDFDLTATFSQPAENVGFYFGGQAIVVNVSLGDQLRFGEIEDIDQPLTARPAGIPSPGLGNNTLVYPGGRNGATVYFDFTEPVGEIAGGPVRFDFDPNLRPITTAGGQDQALFGVAIVENVAQGIFAPGFDSLRFGLRTFTYEEIGVRQGARLDFQFVQGYEPPTAQNVPFQFIQAAGFGPASFIATLFGSHSVVNAAEALYVTGFDASRYGLHEITVGGFEQTITTQGFVATQFGAPLLTFTQVVSPPSIKVDQYGAPIFTFTQVIAPFGFDAARYNDLHRVRDKAELLQTIPLETRGIAGTVFGTQRVELFNRRLNLTGYVATQFGAQRIAHRVRELRPTGFNATRYGNAHRVEYRVRFIDQIGQTYTQFGQTLIFNFDPTQYVTPPGLLATVFGGTEAENFIRYLSPPSIESTAFVSRFFDVANYDREVRPFGHFSQRMGTPALEERIDYPIRPPGQDYSAYGAPTVYNLTQIAAPAGFAAAVITNSHEVFNDERGFVRPGGILQTTFGANVSVRFGQFFVRLLDQGIEPGGFGDALVAYGVRRAFPEGFEAAIFGVSEIENAIRPPIFVAPIPPIGFGTARITFRVRVLGAQSFRTTKWGIPTVGFHQEIAPAGYDASLFGETVFRDNTLEVRPFGIPPGLVSPVAVSLFVRRLLPPTLGVQTQFPRGGLEQHRVRNNVQFVRPFTDNPQTWGPYFGSFNLIENRNRTIRPNGFNVSRVSTPQEVRNTAVPIRPGGYIAALFGQALAAYAVRAVRPDTIEAFPISNFHEVYNDARVVAPFGFRADSHGIPEEVRNANRFLGQFFPYVGPEAGTPFVAERVRELHILFGIEPPFWPLPTVFNLAQFVRPEGFSWPDETGAHNVREQRNIIAPRWILLDRFGFASVRNLTPELGQQGRDQSEHGRPSVRLQFRVLLAQGSVLTLFGRSDISRGIRFVSTSGFRASRLDRFHVVSLGNPELPFPQRIEPVQIPEDDGTALRALIGAPSIRTNVLFAEGYDAAIFGETNVLANSIFPKGILLLADKAFGTPSVNPGFTVRPQGIDDFSSPKHRVDPHTIWCRFDAPSQALRNHDNRSWEFMDKAGPTDNGARPFFGRAIVSNRNRTIVHRANSDQFGGRMTRFGTAGVSLRRRIVEVESFRPLRVGIPFLLGGQRGLTAFGFEMGEMGQGHEVAYFVPDNVTQFIRPPGFVSFVTGAHRIELLNRTITVNGINISVVQRPSGVSRSPRFLEPGGLDATQYGEQWASNFIRTVEPVGEDLAQMEYGLGFFNSRMRVRVRNYLTNLPTHHTAFGTAVVAPRNRGIVQTDEIGRGGVGRPECFTRNIVALGGFGLEAGSFGDVDRWEENRIKPHGDELSRLGTPRITRIIQASVGEVFAAGTPATARQIMPGGFETLLIGGGGPALVGPHGCGLGARAVYPGAFVPPEVGTPTLN